MLFFWHRFELPALVLGHVSVDRPRMSIVPAAPVDRPGTPEHRGQAAAGARTRTHHTDSVPSGEVLIPNVQLQPRHLTRQRSQSTNSSSTADRMSRQSSTLFDDGGSGEGGSLMFLMSGEGVLPRPQTPSSTVGSVSMVSSFPSVTTDSPRMERNISRPSLSSDAGGVGEDGSTSGSRVTPSSRTDATPRSANLSQGFGEDTSRGMSGPVLPRSLDG